MSLDEVSCIVRRVTADLFLLTPDELADDTDLRDELGADSMALVELVIGLEEAFDARMDRVVEARVRTIGDIEKVVFEGLARREHAGQ